MRDKSEMITIKVASRLWLKYQTEEFDTAGWVYLRLWEAHRLHLRLESNLKWRIYR